MGAVLDLLADLIGSRAGHGDAKLHGTPCETCETCEEARAVGLPRESGQLRSAAKFAKPEARERKNFADFARLRNTENRPQSKQTCGSSQSSQTSQGVDRENASAAPEPTCDGWLLIRPDGRSVEVYTSERLTLAQMAARHPRCEVAALPERTDPPPRPLTIAERMSLDNWLARLGSDDPAEAAALIAQCEADMSARVFFLTEARASCRPNWHPPARHEETDR